VKDARNVLFVGPIGTGKPHLAIALGVEAARKRHHVAFWRAADLVRTLVEARDQRELSRLQRRLLRVEVLILDELGFVPFDRTGGELLFNVIADRYERKSVMLTSYEVLLRAPHHPHQASRQRAGRRRGPKAERSSCTGS